MSKSGVKTVLHLASPGFYFLAKSLLPSLFSLLPLTTSPPPLLPFLFTSSLPFLSSQLSYLPLWTHSQSLLNFLPLPPSFLPSSPTLTSFPSPSITPLFLHRPLTLSITLSPRLPITRSPHSTLIPPLSLPLFSPRTTLWHKFPRAYIARAP